MPEISVVMPVYNGEKYIKETIDSILNQSFTDFEFVIVNDGSTDKTRAIIESYNDGRIKLYNLEENRGVGYASNHSVVKANGKYIARADADDIYHPDRLYLQKKYLDENPNITLVKTFVEYFGDEEVEKTDRYLGIKKHLELNKNRCTSPEEISKTLLWHICIPHSSMMIRANILKKFGYRSYRIAEDYELFFKLNELGYKMGTVKEKLTKVRVTNTSLTAKNKILLYENVYEIKRKYIDQLFGNNDVFLWGAGDFGQNVIKILDNRGLEVFGFIDSDINKQGEKIYGREIYSKDMLTEKSKVIVTSMPGRESIIGELEKLGLEHLRDYVIYL
ncbi:MAG: glycosyltransferase [Bacilli bacterium]